MQSLVVPVNDSIINYDVFDFTIIYTVLLVLVLENKI